MEAADNRVNLLNARHFLRLAHGVHDPGMAAGGDHDEALSLDVEAGGVLVHVLIRHNLPLQFGSRIVAVVTASGFLGIIHRCVRKHAFD